MESALHSPEEDSSELLLPPVLVSDSTAWCWAMISLGAFLRCSRRSSLQGEQVVGVMATSAPWSTHVSPPSPMEVKKLMAKRVLRGLSRGIRPSNAVNRNLYSGCGQHDVIGYYGNTRGVWHTGL